MVHISGNVVTCAWPRWTLCWRSRI